MNTVAVRDYKDVLLSIARKAIEEGPGFAQQDYVLSEAGRVLGIKGDLREEQRLLDSWNQLFTSNCLMWGYNLNNPSHPFFHEPIRD